MNANQSLLLEMQQKHKETLDDPTKNKASKKGFWIIPDENIKPKQREIQ